MNGWKKGCRLFKFCSVRVKRITVTCYHVRYVSYTEHQWKVTNVRTINKGALLVLSEQRSAVTSAFISVVYSPMYRYYRKWYSSWMNARHPFVYEHQLFSLVSMGNCKVVVLPKHLSFAFSIWWNNRNISMAFHGISFRHTTACLFLKIMYSKFEKPQNARAAAAPYLQG